jgi:hypothetical protein
MVISDKIEITPCFVRKKMVISDKIKDAKKWREYYLRKSKIAS